MNNDKWRLIEAISKASNHYGDKLVELMSSAKCQNLQQVTEEQAEQYCVEHHIGIQEEVPDARLTESSV